MAGVAAQSGQKTRAKDALGEKCGWAEAPSHALAGRSTAGGVKNAVQASEEHTGAPAGLKVAPVSPRTLRRRRTAAS